MTKKTRQLLCMLAVSTLMLIACTGVEDSAEQHAPTPAAQQSVSFGAYVGRSTTRGNYYGRAAGDSFQDAFTRGGYQGQLTTATLQGDAQGFGVFAFYTDNRLYEQSDTPNFMYNQQVTYQGGQWQYAPVKYWPNEFGEEASSAGEDRLTFFAYAPYAAVDATTGRVLSNPATGITALTRNFSCGDPAVRYYSAFAPGESVDLCWASPKIDQTKSQVQDRINFEFHHALTALNVQIDADIDVKSHETSTLDGNTRIWVRSVTFEGFATRGQLNLYSGNWNNLDCDCDVTSLPVTVYDGRRNGYEGITATKNESPVGLNPIVVQDTPYTVDGTTITAPGTDRGVTNTTVNLFDVSGMPSSTDGERAAALGAPVYLIPTGEPLRITIVYDVETYDPKLAANFMSDARTHGSSIQNTISATVTTDGTTPVVLEAGKRYVVGLHLGMTSVKMKATVAEWVYGDTAEVPLSGNDE